MAGQVETILKVHAAIARALIDNGTDTLFGLMGDANLYVVDSFIRESRGTYVAAANESGAALMALGYSSVSGKVGVATVTHGAALVNTMTSLVEGVKAALPMLLLCGDTPVEDKDHLQKVPQRDLLLAAGVGFEQLRAPRTLFVDIATAFRRAIIERRPIALNMPADFQWVEVPYQPIRYRVPDIRAIAPSSADLDDAIGIIAASKRPLILAGRGAIHAREAIIQLAKRLEAPVSTTLKGKSLFQGEPFNLGIFGTLSSPSAVDAIMASDCIIAFGAGLNSFTTSQGSFLNGKRIVQVSLDPGGIGRYAQPDVGLVGDSKLIAEAIVHWLNEAEIPASGFRAELQSMREAAALETDPSPSIENGTVDIRVALRRLNKAVPLNRLFVTDGGRFVNQCWRIIDVSDPASFVYTVNIGSIGLGMSYAIGCSFAAPGRPTLLVTGDGGFMLGGLVEFNTAVRTKVDLIVIICNDGSYGAEYIQFQNRDMDPGPSIFNWPDFAPVANSLGGTGITVRTLEDLETAARAIENRRGPVLIDVKLDPGKVPRDVAFEN